MNISPTPGTLAQGVCYASEQERLNDFSAHQTIVIPDSVSTILVQTPKPSAAQQTYIWWRLVNGYPERFYKFINGLWVSPHSLPAGAIGLYEGALADLATYDGGDSNPITAVTGPMWAEATEYQGRSLMHPGAIPDTVDTLAVQANYGVGKHPLVFAEMLNHAHGTGNSVNGPADAPTWIKRSWSKVGTVCYAQDWTEGPANVTFSLDAGDRGTTEALVGDNASTAHPTVHPVRGCYVVRRTARTHFVVP